MEHVEVLSLVFVKAFDLDVEQRFRIHFDPFVGKDVFGQTLFGGQLDLAELVAESFLFELLLHVREFFQIVLPLVSDGGVDQFGQFGVGILNPAPGSDSVRLVVETIGEHLGKVGEDSGS